MHTAGAPASPGTRMRPATEREARHLPASLSVSANPMMSQHHTILVSSTDPLRACADHLRVLAQACDSIRAAPGEPSALAHLQRCTHQFALYAGLSNDRRAALDQEGRVGRKDSPRLCSFVERAAERARSNLLRASAAADPPPASARGRPVIRRRPAVLPATRARRPPVATRSHGAVVGVLRASLRHRHVLLNEWWRQALRIRRIEQHHGEIRGAQVPVRHAVVSARHLADEHTDVPAAGRTVALSAPRTQAYTRRA